MSKLVQVCGVLAGTVLALGLTVPAARANTGPNPRTKVIYAQNARPDDFFKCDLAAGFYYSTAYPGYIQGTAYYKSCEGEPYPNGCSNVADLWIDLPKLGWVLDHQGGTEHGCPPDSTPSVNTQPCHSTPDTYSYQTRGIFVISWDGRNDTENVDSSIYNLKRVC
jgi:hypothetical protein